MARIDHVVSGLQFRQKPDLECDKSSLWCRECKSQVESENEWNLYGISRYPESAKVRWKVKTKYPGRFKLRVTGGKCGHKTCLRVTNEKRLAKMGRCENKCFTRRRKANAASGV